MNKMTRETRCAVCYDPRQSTANAASEYSPSSSKPSKLVDVLQRDDWPLDWLPVTPVDENDLALAHDRDWVQAVLRSEADNGFGNRSAEVAATLPWSVGSMVAACRAANPNRPALSPSSGFHHAGWATAQGFCTFNGLVVAARVALAEGARKVAILDADAHYGNGTAEILSRLALDGSIKHWTIGSTCRVQVHSYDQTPQQAFALNGHLRQRYLEMIEHISTWLDEVGPDLLIYQAGADPHINDPYGGVLTTADLAYRDRTVFDEARKKCIRVAFNLAGGYQVDKSGSIAPVLALHLNTLRTACGLPEIIVEEC